MGENREAQREDTVTVSDEPGRAVVRALIWARIECLSPLVTPLLAGPRLGLSEKQTLTAAFCCNTVLNDIVEQLIWKRLAQSWPSTSSTVAFAVLKADKFRLPCHRVTYTQGGWHELSLNDYGPRLVSG